MGTWNWKQEKHGICLKNYERDEATNKQTICDFLEVTKTKIRDFFKSVMYNLDQSIFRTEMRAKFILSSAGGKHMETAAQSVHALTHSYIIMLIINMDVSFFLCLCIYLQEASGTFGLFIQQSVFGATNLLINALHSDKMDR
jgi:hypothetical protein